MTQPSPADVLTTPTDQAPSTADVTPPSSTARATRGKPKRGRVVSFVFTDAISGAKLDGLGVAVDVPDDGSAVCVAPIASNYLFVPAEGVQVVELDG